MLDPPRSLEDSRLWGSLCELGVMSDEELVSASLAELERVRQGKSPQILALWLEKSPAVRKAIMNSLVVDSADMKLLRVVKNVELPVKISDGLWAQLNSDQVEVASLAAQIIIQNGLFPEDTWQRLELVKNSLPRLQVWLAWARAAPEKTPSSGTDTLLPIFRAGIARHRVSLVKYSLAIIEIIHMKATEEVKTTWRRYMTLVGIAFIDASSNQMSASGAEFALALNKNSPLALGWLQCLIEAALQSNIVPVRHEIVKILLTLEPDSLWTLAQMPLVYSSTLLKLVLAPTNFEVTKSSDGYRCNYDLLLQGWIERLGDQMSALQRHRFVSELCSMISTHTGSIPPYILLVRHLRQWRLDAATREQVANMIKEWRASSIPDKMLVNELSKIADMEDMPILHTAVIEETSSPDIPSRNGQYEMIKDLLVRQANRSWLYRYVATAQVENASTIYDLIRESKFRRGMLGTIVQAILNSPRQRWHWQALAQAFCLVPDDSPMRRLDDYVCGDEFERWWGAPSEGASRAAIAVALSDISDPAAAAELIEAVKGRLVPQSRLETVSGDCQKGRIMMLQMILLLWKKQASDYDLSPILYNAIVAENAPRVRLYVIWLLALVSIRASTVDDIHAKLRKSEEPRITAALCRVLVLCADSKNVEKIVIAILPLATSNRVMVRHTAAACLVALEPKFEFLHPSLRQASAAAVVLARSSEKFLHEGVEWDALDLRPGPVCGSVASRVLEPSNAPDSYLVAADFSTVASNCDIGPTYISREKTTANQVTREINKSATEFWSGGAIVPLDEMSSLQTKSDGNVDRTELVVVATLCDKLPNLGGICRLCDALGAALLVIGDERAASTSEFRSTAVSADRWMPMTQVTETELAGWLEIQKVKGYTLVGLEQTDTSRKLGRSTEFDKLTVLVIGRERLGIPAPILSLMDWCVEIEQRGVVRSMNVQTATAVIIQAYNYQHT